MALTIHTRRRIFYTLVVLFVILGGGVVGYAQGWRLDFSTWRFEKVGGIYVRAYPQNADIYLDGKPVQNESGFLSAGTLISDLLPGTYSVSLKAAGYNTWQENAAVSPSLVTQFKYAVLVPSDGTPVPSSTLSATLQTLASLAPTSTAIDLFDSNQKIITSQNKISIFDIATATTTASTTIPGKNLKVEWITPNLVGVLQTTGEFYLYNIGQTPPTKLADDVTSFAATADGTMVATLERNSLEIFTIGGGNGGGGTEYYRFNLPNVGDAQSVIWYKDNEHLFIVYSDRVAFLDLADSDLVNFTIVVDGTKPQYDPGANALYIRDDSGKLIEFAFSN